MNINKVIPLSDTPKIVSDDGHVGIFNIKPYLNYEVFQPLKEVSEFMKISRPSVWPVMVAQPNCFVKAFSSK